MKFVVLMAIAYALFTLGAAEALGTLLALWAMYVFLIQRKPARVYRRSRR